MTLMEYLTNNNQALMLIITFVYVIATIAICLANFKSAKASREQLTESQRQFKEMNRAFVTVSFEIIRSGLAVLHIRNNGNQIARNVRITVDPAFVKNMAHETDKKCVERLNESVFPLGVNQSWYICIGSHLQLEQMSKELLSIFITYSDSFTEYAEKAEIDLGQYNWAMIYDSPSEDTYQQIKKIEKSLCSIDDSMKNINRSLSREEGDNSDA